MPRPRQAASLGQAASEWHGRSVERVVERVELGTNTGRFRETSKQTTEYQYKQNPRDARAIPAARRAIVRGVIIVTNLDLPLRIPTTGGLHNREALARLGTRLRHGAHHRPRRHGQ